MKSWKKQLKKELAIYTPELNDEVKNATIISNIEKKSENPKNSFFKKYWGFPTAFVILLILCIGLWSLLKPKTQPTTFVYTLDINPSFVFMTDEKGNVLSIQSLNEEADVVLVRVDSDSLLKTPIYDAMTTCIDMSAQLGYFKISDQGDAVLIRGLKDTSSEQLDEISSSIRHYFSEKGFYGICIQEELDLLQFCEEFAIPSTNDISVFVNQIQGLERLYGSRGVNENNLSVIYEEYVIGAQMFQIMKTFLEDNINEIYDNASLLLKIFKINTQIMVHKDNPSLFLKDYWSLSNLADKKYTEEFAELMLEMEIALNEYEMKFGIYIQSVEDLSHILETYNSISLEDIMNLGNISMSDFIKSPEYYITMLKNIGLDTTILEEILCVPETFEEYIAQLEKMNLLVSNKREEEFRGAYDQHREPIPNDEYQVFIDAIEREYGSLKNYWESQKNK